jgi:hypothetical protein
VPCLPRADRAALIPHEVRVQAYLRASQRECDGKVQRVPAGAHSGMRIDEDGSLNKLSAVWMPEIGDSIAFANGAPTKAADSQSNGA